MMSTRTRPNDTTTNCCNRTLRRQHQQRMITYQMTFGMLLLFVCFCTFIVPQQQQQFSNFAQSFTIISTTSRPIGLSRYGNNNNFKNYNPLLLQSPHNAEEQTLRQSTILHSSTDNDIESKNKNDKNESKSISTNTDSSATTTSATTTTRNNNDDNVIITNIDRTSFDDAGRSLLDEQDTKRMNEMGDFDVNPNVSFFLFLLMIFVSSHFFLLVLPHCRFYRYNFFSFHCH
jgi:hypothetical protein